MDTETLARVIENALDEYMVDLDIGGGVVGYTARAILASPEWAAFVREVKAAAWDECAVEAHDLGWMHDNGWRDVHARNPYEVSA
jgi:hypothetical protein